MEYKISKEFAKALEKLNGKELKTVLAMLDTVEAITNINEIPNLKKLINFSNVYRIRIGAKRAFFLFHIEIENDTIFFKYLVSRGQAYDKKMESLLRKLDI